MSTTDTSAAPADAILAATPAVATGYVTDLQFFASRYQQGGRTVYSLDLTPAEIISFITRPDPSEPSPGNRAIRPKHAADFGKYLRKRDDWVSPSMMLRAPSPFSFAPDREAPGIQFGIVTIPRRNLIDLHIVDGQHRILGMFLAEKEIADDLEKAFSNLASVRKVEPGGRAEADAREIIAGLEKQRDRLTHQRINLQIVIVADEKEYRQMFFDIADNQVGITASVKSRFDSTKVVNRTLQLVLDHPLLVGRVDPESDRARGNNLMGAKHVAEIIRVVAKGIDGRVSKRDEVEMSEMMLASRTKDFLDLLVESFPEIRDVMLGKLASTDLRHDSLLGSVLFVRVLAGVYHDLIVDRGWDRDLIEQFFEKLAPHTSGPTYEDDIWMQHVPYSFELPGAMAPNGRRQNLVAFKNDVVGWAIDKPDWLDEAPAPRPAPEENWVDPEQGSGYTAFGADVPKG